MKKIHATIVYPVEVNIFVDERASRDEVWEKVVEAGNKEITKTSVAPVIHSSSDNRLNNIKLKETLAKPDTQAEWVDAAMRGLVNAQNSLYALSSAKPFFNNMKTKNNKSLVDKINTTVNLVSELLEDLIIATTPKPKN